MRARPVDSATFPALADYLDHLPHGLASYPEAKSAGIILKSAIASQYFHPTWKALPDELIAVLKRPPLPTSWVPTVLTDAVFCIVADTFYPTKEAMVKWTYDRTARLASLPMYGSIARMAGLERFLRTAAKVHSLFQRGTDVVVDVRGNEAVILLTHVAYLHGALNHLSNEGAFKAGLESAGARDVELVMLESRATFARYRARWRP